MVVASLVSDATHVKVFSVNRGDFVSRSRRPDEPV